MGAFSSRELKKRDEAANTSSLSRFHHKQAKLSHPQLAYKSRFDRIRPENKVIASALRFSRC